MWAAANRKSEEIDRRNLELRTQKANSVFAQKKLVSRIMAKDHNMRLKQTTLNILIDEGLLRKRQEFSFHYKYVPQLYNQVNYNIKNKEETQEHFTDIISESTKVVSKMHKMAILKEFKRRDEMEKERLRLQKQQ